LGQRLIFGWYEVSIFLILKFETDIKQVQGWYYLRSLSGSYSDKAGIASRHTNLMPVHIPDTGPYTRGILVDTRYSGGCVLPLSYYQSIWFWYEYWY
jgi:hypothetical protein